MEKLRKYVQECGGDIVYSDYDKVATLEDLEYNYRYIRFLLSPEAMFIKWLVQNDKIDLVLDNIIHKHKGIDFDTGKGIVVEKLCDRYESLLMLLAIQDNPIEFLCSVLK